MVLKRRSTRPPSRSALVGVLLVLTLGLAGVMAHQAWEATRSHRRIAEKSLKEHTTSAAWQLVSAIRLNLEHWYLGPGLELVASAGGAYPGIPLKSLDAILKAGQGYEWPFWAKGLDYFFRLDLGTGELEFRGETTPTAEEARWLRDLLEVEWSLGPSEGKRSPKNIVFRRSGDDIKMVGFGVYPEPGEAAKTAFGFQTDLTPLKVILTEIEAATPLFPPALTGGKSNADLFSFMVTTSTGQVLYRSALSYPDEFEATDTVGKAFGNLRGTVRLNPKAAEVLVIGGLPRSRLPTILGVLALASTLVVVAIFQLRREQELALLRTDFVSSVSHQLRTPLAQIRMFGETLLLGRVRSDEERLRSLEIIVREAQRLTHQVENVLHFSRAQRGEIRLSPQPLLLAPVVREVLESFCPLAEAQDCRVEAELEDDLEAQADPVATRQMLLNLLENAVKYGPPDQTVTVTLRRGKPGTVQLLVDDQGAGIPPEKRGEVFEPYSRLERDRDSGVAGSGIGLSVVRELARGQGGSVWVEPALGGGARFVVELPEAEERSVQPRASRVGDEALHGSPAEAPPTIA